jgi:hypothetical protein
MKYNTSKISNRDYNYVDKIPQINTPKNPGR